MSDYNSKTQHSNNYSNTIDTFNLTKTYQKFRAVESLSINVNPGDIYGFLGPNGAGKTTTIRMLCGLLTPSSGTAKIAGLDVVKDGHKIRKIIGLLPESAGFYNWMNAEEYLHYFATLYKIEFKIAKKSINDLLEKVGLATKSSIPIGYYSRGMRQRLGLARTLINEPQIIFLDEPTLGLDPKGQQDIQRILLDLNHQNNVTIFFSSHALNEVSNLCNRIAIVDKGRLVAEGSIDELRKLVGNPSENYVITVLNLPSTQKALSNLPLKFETNTVNNGKGLMDVFIMGEEEEESPSANKVIEIFEKLGLQIYEVKRMNSSLEDIFFKLTDIKKQPRDKKVIYGKDESIDDKRSSIGHDTANLKLKNNRSE